MPFTYAGAILSRWLRVPLILEFNGSNVWMAQHWDPMKFGSWLRMCEDVSLAHAWLIVVVSEVLRDELVACGISESRILVNPNAVDPDFFRPG
ncbi:MAG: glycosyltransferase WbuB, partial [Acidobacteria bacterium]